MARVGDFYFLLPFVSSQLVNGNIKVIIKISLHFLISQFANIQFFRYMSFVPVCNGTHNRGGGGTELCNLYHFYIHILLLGSIYFYFKKINIKKIPKQNNQIIQFMFYIVVMPTHMYENVWPQWDVIFEIFLLLLLDLITKGTHRKILINEDLWGYNAVKCAVRFVLKIEIIGTGVVLIEIIYIC